MRGHEILVIQSLKKINKNVKFDEIRGFKPETFKLWDQGSTTAQMSNAIVGGIPKKRYIFA